MKRFGIIVEEIPLGDITLKKGSILCCAADGMIELQNGTKVYCSFDRFISEHKSDGITVTDKFKLTNEIPLGEFILKPGSILCRTDDNQIKLPNRTIVYCSFYSFCLVEHHEDGIFVDWNAKMRRAHLVLLANVLKNIKY